MSVKQQRSGDSKRLHTDCSMLTHGCAAGGGAQAVVPGVGWSSPCLLSGPERSDTGSAPFSPSAASPSVKLKGKLRVNGEQEE